jgi:hypothetical protein
MTMIVSVFGILGRFAGDLMMSALGWASSLLFGRVPRSHQIYLVLMMAGSFLWIVAVLGIVVPSVATFVLTSTPHPLFIDLRWFTAALFIILVALPLLVGAAGYLVPADGERVEGAGAVVEVLRGYLLTPLLSALLIFMAGVGIVRKIRSLRHGWVETHVPIVAVPGRYDAMVVDLQRGLATGGTKVDARDAPRVLTLPAMILTRVAGPNVRKLRPDRLIDLCGHDLRIGVYPYDIAISSNKAERMRLRAAVMDALGNADAHLTTSAEAQAVEARIQKLGEAVAAGAIGSDIELGLEDVDRQLLRLVVSAEEWDILYRQRLKLECTYLRPGTRRRPELTPGPVPEQILTEVPVG